MAKKFNGFPWDQTLGKKPRGGLDQPELHGNFQGRATYLDKHICSNPNCKANIARFVDSGEICDDQTVAIRGEGAMYYEYYQHILATRDQWAHQREHFEYRRVHDDQNREGFQKLANKVQNAIDEADEQAVLVRDAMKATGFIYFHLEEDAAANTLQEVITFANCDLYNQLYEQLQSKILALPSGLEQDDPARKITSELPSNFDLDDKLLKGLFSKYTPSEPDTYTGSDGAEE